MKVHVTTRSTRIALLLLLVLLAGLLAACGGDDEGGDEPQDVTIGLSFVPNVQFAPYYVALEKGYYEDAGLNVTLNHHAAGGDLFGPLVAGQEDMLMAGGDEVLQGRAAATPLPLVYVAEVFRAYPVALIVPADSDIQSVADVAGKKVGIPGPFGANYIGLLALLQANGLTEDDITVESVGFTQAAALLSGQVDAVMGYINNEPIQLEKGGMATRTFPVSEVEPFVSNGLVALEETIDEDPEMVRAVVEATLKGLAETIADPEAAVEISKEYVPTLADDAQAADALAVLQATLPLWQSDRAPGASDPAAWQAMADFLAEHGLLEGEVDVATVWNDGFLPDGE